MSGLPHWEVYYPKHLLEGLNLLVMGHTDLSDLCPKPWLRWRQIQITF
jgi:hypothetical protein